MNLSFLLLLTIIPQSFGLNALFLSIGAAGHSIPMFELAKAMKNHNVTFITEAFAQSYINVEMYSNRSSFRLIFTNDSIDAIMEENKIEQDIIEYFMDHSLFDSLFHIMPAIGRITNALMHKAIHELMSNRFDVVISSSLVLGVHALCQKANISCVIQREEIKLSIFDVNLPTSYSLLSSKQITEFKYRIYNVAFYSHLIMTIFKKLIETFYMIFQSFPQIPGPFYDTFTLKSLLFTQSNCLNLIGIPPTLYPPSYSHHLTKYLGGFIDELSIDYVDNDLTRWIKSKPMNSIIYVAFGSTGIVS
ncbi:unnamed protein product [Rotaria sp. Silwood2]|nr:unnamed protein product [Rotaria sp. Silwood2]CAF2823460.1 unnamed protein product [Rotaria sp. Silwood2]CAF3430703.1 unnamed protein product [Rotaria sp. Silwood2]CAF3960364.1 unnamed protein product [Rotaria sp. Silwood2]CAF4263163.1 unnamed protein product [Rotaria sp. Silwood2]